MIKFLVCGTIATCGLIIAVTSLEILGPGRWDVLNVAQCDNPDQYEVQIFVHKKKFTRDKDCYNGNLTLVDRLDESYAIRIELCVTVDGGCKPYQNYSDDSFINYIKRYAQHNVEKALLMSGVDPPEFPMEPGVYHIENYVFDYCELLRTGVYGKYGTDVFLIKDGKNIGCMHYLLEFRAGDDSCDGSNEDDEEEE
ncbi:hypothetical protein ABMA27_003333 [Loxostege sticticalis]|uniref:Uncharacterized protein n=1 Tax=Loxostege sticticalis TaxID=481309 RepID=A0ABR3HSS4_LOXSC